MATAENVAPAAPVATAHMVPIDLIRANPENNTRLTYNEAEMVLFAAALKKEGQLEAVVCYPIGPGSKDGCTHDLVVGFRRLAAAKLLGWTELSVTVIPNPKDRTARLYTNLSENMVRKDLAPYELATACARLAEYGESKPAIAARLDLSGSHVGNMIRLKQNLHPTLWAQFAKDRSERSGDNPRAPKGETLMTFISYAAMSHEEQLAAWEAKQNPPDESGGKGGEGGEDGGEDETPTKRKPGKKAIEVYLKALRTIPKAERDVLWKGSCDTILWLMGDRKGPPVKVAGPETAPKAKGKGKKGDE